MRDIKFRFWNKEKKIMCYNNEDDSSGYWDGVCCSPVALINNELNSQFTRDEYEIMQYTGLHDKNGVEIYDGDIVKALINGIWYVGQVIYEHSGFIIDVMNNKQLEFGRRGIIERFTEVIGNIYDNSKLLKGE